MCPAICGGWFWTGLWARLGLSRLVLSRWLPGSILHRRHFLSRHLWCFWLLRWVDVNLEVDHWAALRSGCNIFCMDLRLRHGKILAHQHLTLKHGLITTGVSFYSHFCITSWAWTTAFCTDTLFDGVRTSPRVLHLLVFEFLICETVIPRLDFFILLRLSPIDIFWFAFHWESLGPMHLCTRGLHS